MVQPTSQKTDSELKALYGEQYVAMYESKPISRLRNLLTFFQLSQTDYVVDFGCGNGMLLPLIADKITRYTGVDFSPTFIKAARERKEKLSIQNAQFFCSDIHEFARTHQNEFNTAFALDFSEHVYDADWKAILKSINRTLKPGGRLYLHTPNADFFIEIMKKHNFILRQFPEHIAVRNMEENTRLVTESGFDVTKTKLISHYNVLKPLHHLRHIPILGKYFKARILIEATKPEN